MLELAQQISQLQSHLTRRRPPLGVFIPTLLEQLPESLRLLLQITKKLLHSLGRRPQLWPGTEPNSQSYIFIRLEMCIRDLPSQDLREGDAHGVYIAGLRELFFF